MTESKVTKASLKAHALDDATQSLIKRVEAKDRRFRTWCYISLILLLLVGVTGIWKQNEIANKNKQHIDCIVKLFTTPLPATAKSRTITNPSSTCNIKFT